MIQRSRPVLLALALGAKAAQACPVCATHDSVSVWPIVGAFLLVPPILAIAVLYALRRELRPDGEPRTTARVLPFAKHS